MVNDACFSEEESDSSHSTKSFSDAKLSIVSKHKKHTNKKEELITDSDNDSLMEYKLTKKVGKKKFTNENQLGGERKQKSLYKTELCRNWEETGQCRYGIKCQYAHGAQDLREIERHPKYKTQKCRTFHKTGACPYGARCTFRHFSLPGDREEDEEEEGDAAPRPHLFTHPIFPLPHAWYPKQRPCYAPEEDDALLPINAESLLPHQLLFDLDHNQIPPPFYQPEDALCKSFLRPWFI
ncbi:hypothetical protein BY458DRAFT_535251 [Sporodiniella umbellata]|nr:hypothetical protein BY458DRAFT_535251 [Sporodiniella umbellata]